MITQNHNHTTFVTNCHHQRDILMRSKWLVLASCLGCVLDGSAQSIVNGSFEQGPAISGRLLTVHAVDSSTLTGWTVSSNDLEIITSVEWPADDGNRSIDLNGVTNATLFQDVGGLTPGRQYSLSFSLSGNPFIGGDPVGEGDPIKNVRVSAGNVTADFEFDVTPYLHPSGSPPPSMGWRRESVTFTASSATQRIQFASLDPSNSTRGPAIDNVSLALIQRPLLVLQTTGGTPVSSNQNVTLAAVPVGVTGVPFSFVIANTGDAPLTIASIAATSGNVADFNLSSPLPSSVSPGATASFNATFSPMAPGTRSCTVGIGNNSAASPFVFQLSGVALDPSADTDHDGLNDVAEYNLSALGFDWQVSQAALVATLYAGANSAGLYQESQIRALRPATPLIIRDPLTKRVRLTIDWKKSLDLQQFYDFPAPQGSSVSFDAAGDIIFEFASEEDAAFFRF